MHVAIHNNDVCDRLPISSSAVCLFHVRVPACSTIHAILDRHGLVARQTRSRTQTEGTPLSQGLTPNALLCTDYKGEFMLGDKRYCYPLTVSDYASRYLLLCEAMQSVKEQAAFTAFERLFKERGLAHAIRSDNGVLGAVLTTLSFR